MGEELVSGSALPIGERVDESALSSFSFSEEFEKHLPYFLSVGMTYEQYYDGDVDLCKYYRKSDEIKKDRQNEMLWLQGLYIYDALIKVAPAFRSMGASKPDDYPKEPYPLTEKEQLRREERDTKKRFEQMIEKMTELSTEERSDEDVNNDS